MAQGHAGTPGQGRVIRFDGTQEEAFPAWRMWAKAHLRTRTRHVASLDGTMALENEEELAAELITLIVPESPAWEAIRHLADDMETMIFTRGGLQRVWECLEERFPLKQIMNRKGESLDAVFKIKPVRGETAGGYIGRARGVFTRAKALGLLFAEDIKGYILLRATRCSEEHQALVLANSHQAWEFEAIADAMRISFPEMLPEASP